MRILSHHIYEYKKGLRSLILHTMDSSFEEEVRSRLKKHDIPYLIRYVTEEKINVFFGSPSCIRVLQLIGDKPLAEFSVEEDFVLGTMLGYGLTQQCERFENRKNKYPGGLKKIS